MVASVHSHFRMLREEMTARVIRAVSNPLVTMLGHPTGRLLLARDSYAVDLDAVIEAAARAGTMIEINANPHRLDIDAVHCRRAAQKGVRIVINPDAHSVAGLQDLTYGVSVARRAWLAPADLLNTASLEKVAKQLELMRTRGGSGKASQARLSKYDLVLAKQHTPSPGSVNSTGTCTTRQADDCSGLAGYRSVLIISIDAPFIRSMIDSSSSVESM